MAHEYSCRRDTIEPARAEQTVRDVAQRGAGAIEALKKLGINHCCGAHLTLTEAAASAGVPLDALLAALNRDQADTLADCEPAPSRSGGRIVLDVRGLEPPQPMVRVLEQLEQLGPGAELEVRHDRRPVFLYPQLEKRGFQHETDQPQPGLVRIVIRRREV
ncbi:MAG TPA: DUF542 domain-containing protein [Candidatus Methylomirabilis sp.]|nr:DUF542 domain-containing protein [Candidatus Methylomirabilis sp.]